MDLSTSIRQGYTLETNAGIGNNDGITMSVTVRGLTDGQLKTKLQAEGNRNVQEHCRYLSGQSYQNALKNNAKNPGRLRPSDAEKAMWQKWCDDGAGSIDLAQITRQSSGAGESMEMELTRRLAGGESVEDIIADITRRAQEQAEALRSDASDTVQTGESTVETSDEDVAVAA